MSELPLEGQQSDLVASGSVMARHLRRRSWAALGRLDLSIERVPLPLAGKERAAWRVTALALCLAGCRGQSATVEQLHVLTWALRDGENGARLLEAWGRGPDYPTNLRAWDNSLDDTLKLAQAAGLIEAQSSGRRKLSELGRSLVAAVRSSEDGLMIDEQRFLASLGQISESAMWRRLGTPPKAPKENEGETLP